MASESESNSGQKVMNAFFWIICIALLGYLAYSIFLPKGPSANNNSPEALVQSYTEFVEPFLAPNLTTPNAINIDEFLAYFDSDSEKFFNENVEKLAYLYYVTLNKESPTPWKDITSGMRRSYAVKTMLTFGPLRGLSLIRDPSKTDDLVINVKSTGQTFQLNLEKTPNGLKFDQFMGQQGTISARLATVVIPTEAQ